LTHLTESPSFDNSHGFLCKLTTHYLLKQTFRRSPWLELISPCLDAAGISLHLGQCHHQQRLYRHASLFDLAHTAFKAATWLYGELYGGTFGNNRSVNPEQKGSAENDAQ